MSKLSELRAENALLRGERDSWRRLWQDLDRSSQKHYENLIEDRFQAVAEVEAAVLAIHHEGDGEDEYGPYTVCKGCSASPYPCRTVLAIRELRGR